MLRKIETIDKIKRNMNNLNIRKLHHDLFCINNIRCTYKMQRKCVSMCALTVKYNKKQKVSGRF